MGHMDRMRVPVVSLEPFDEGFSSLESLFNIRKVSEFRFVNMSNFLLTGCRIMTRSQRTSSLVASGNASRKHNVSGTDGTVRTSEPSGHISPCVSGTLDSFVPL